MSTTIQRQAANGLFGKEHAGIVEHAIKENRSKSFHAKLQRIAFNFAADLSESVSGMRGFDMEDLEKHGIHFLNRTAVPKLWVETLPDAQFQNKTLDANAIRNLLDTMKREIKQACKDRGDFWYTVDVDDSGWEIEAYRGKAK